MRNETPWTEKEVGKLIALWESRLVAPDIAERLGRTLRSTDRKLRRLGLKPHPVRKQCSWTPERETMLVRLWKDGLSASQIAKYLDCGISRNAVIGKVHRMGLTGENKPHVTYKRPKKCKPQPVPKPVPVTHPEPDPLYLTTLTIGHNTCRWPVAGVGADTRYCGHRPVDGSSYCAHHRERSIAVVTTRQKKDFTRYAGWLSKRIITAGA